MLLLYIDFREYIEISTIIPPVYPVNQNLKIINISLKIIYKQYILFLFYVFCIQTLKIVNKLNTEFEQI